MTSLSTTSTTNTQPTMPSPLAPLTSEQKAQRLELLKDWIKPLADSYQLDTTSLVPASSDASFRRYFRINSTTGHSYIVMDAPPTHEDVRPFVQIAELFAQAKLTLPTVIEQALEQGFLMLKDLGTTTYLDVLTPENAPKLYQDALSALIQLQGTSQANVLPAYDRALLLRELELFPTWFLERHHQQSLTANEQAGLNKVFAQLLANNLAQPSVYVHRDYHSRNLMYLADSGNPGILDFQDAVYGPITYDLVSLLRDAYIEWPEEQVLDWVIRYWEQARKAGLPVAADPADFYRDFEWMGLQRHLKVLGIFARLYHRDGKDGYLKDLPLVLKYTRKVAERYGAFTPLLHLLDKVEGADYAYTF